MSNKIRFTCPYCKAEFEIPKTFVYATCPYCGTTFRVDNPDSRVEHYIFRVNYDKNSAYRIAKNFALMQVGIAEDFEALTEFVSGYQYYVPLYIYEINVKALCKGEKEKIDENKIEMGIHGGEEVSYVIAPATESIPIPIPKDYSFPSRSRAFFKPSILRDGIYIQPSLDPEQMFSTYKEPFMRQAVSEAQTACGGNFDVIDNSKYIGLAHYPFWDIKYRYRGKEYRTVVDASDGTVIYLEYPISSKARTLGLLAGVGILASSGLIGGLLSIMLINRLEPGFLGGLIASIPGFVVSLQKFARTKGLYKFSPSEEAVFVPIR